MPTAQPFELGASLPNPRILLTGNPGTTHSHIENLQINLDMGNEANGNGNGVPIEKRIKTCMMP